MLTVRKWFAALLLIVLGLTAAAPTAAQRRHKWWQDERFQRTLELSPDQISRLEEVFQQALPALRAQNRALDKLEDELSRMVAEARVAEPEFEQFVDRVEAARSALMKTRTLMLFRMRRILSAEQHQKMIALHDELERERHRDRDGRDSRPKH